MLKHLSDEDVMLQVSNGNLDMMTVLFDRYHLRIFNFLNKMVQNKMLSEDLTQDVFVKVLKYRSSYKNGNFTSWIYKVARNIFADYYQKLQKERTNLIDDDTLTDNRFVDEHHQEELDHLQKALALLQPTDRELIVMHRFQEIKYQQIADIVGSSEGAVKVKVHRALKKLKDIYFQNQRYEM